MTKTDFQAEKQTVLDFYSALDAAGPDDAAGVIAAHSKSDIHWRGMHPFHELHGAEAIGTQYWTPLKHAMGPIQRRPDMFLAGLNMMDGYETRWVVQMGHLMGLWDEPWLGIQPSRKIAFLRYVDFHRIEGGKIAETACFIDIIAMLYQAGYQPLPPQTGAHILSPGPRTHDGLLFDPQDEEEGRKTLALISGMVDGLVAEDVNSHAEHMQEFWTPDMCWFGPAGIGASAFFKGYRRGHTQPFEDCLEFIKHYGHICRVGEGNFGGFFGYPSMLMKCTGGYMGMPATDTPADMRIVDMYRREGDKLAENWIFIDLLHFFAMQGLDILERVKEYPRT